MTDCDDSINSDRLLANRVDFSFFYLGKCHHYITSTQENERHDYKSRK